MARDIANGSPATDSRPVTTVEELREVLGVDDLPNKGTSKLESFRRLATREKDVTTGTLFVAQHVAPEEAVRLTRRGVTAFISQSIVLGPDQQPFPTFLHGNPQQAILDFLLYKRGQQHAITIGITGSIGKSTVKNLLRKVAETHFLTSANRGNSNTFGMVSRHIQDLDPATEVFIQETGAYEKGSVTASSTVLSADAFVITSIGLNHVGDYEDDHESLFADKLSYDTTSKPGAPAFINMDDPLLRKVSFTHPVQWYSIDNPDADFFARDIVVNDAQIRFSVVERFSNEATAVTLNTHGKHNVQNAVAAFAVGRWLGIPAMDIAKGLGAYRGSGTRQNLTRLGTNRVLVDCYNASEASIASTSDALQTLYTGPHGKRVLVLGDIDDKLGVLTEEVHRRVGAKLADSGADVVALYGDHMAYAAEEARRHGRDVFHTLERSELNAYLRRILGPMDTLVFKGGQHKALSITIDDLFGSDFLLGDGDELRRRSRHASRDGLRYRIVSGYGAILRSLPAGLSKVTVGGFVRGVPVLMVGRNAFSTADVTSVSVESPVRSLARKAFYGCARLSSVTLPETLKYIGQDAFGRCTALQSVQIPEGVTDIRARAFARCSSLENVYLPSTLQFVESSAFHRCPSVKVSVPADSKILDVLTEIPHLDVVLR